MHPLGPDGYHWRVCVDDPAPRSRNGEKSDIDDNDTDPQYYWWDIVDEETFLPVQSTTASKLRTLLDPNRSRNSFHSNHHSANGNLAKGAFHSWGRVVGHRNNVEDGKQEVPIHVLVFKLLDMSKVTQKGKIRKRRHRARQKQQTSMQKDLLGDRNQPCAESNSHNSIQENRLPKYDQEHVVTPTTTPLMDFEKAPTTKNNCKIYDTFIESDLKWSFNLFDDTTTPDTTQVEEESDITFDEEDPKIEMHPHKDTKEPENTCDETASHEKVDQKAPSCSVSDQSVQDAARHKVDPVIKAWSEEYGTKKQLRALLASLHTVLWPDASWKPVNLGDLLDDHKVKLYYHKASRLVHPDRTLSLDAEQKFLASRIFGVLSEAWGEMNDT